MPDPSPSPPPDAGPPVRRRLSTIQHVLAVGVLGTAIVAVNAAVKEPPDRQLIARMARTQAAPSRWHGRVAPDVELTTLDGRRYQLSDDIGRRVVILNFFATWCGPCRAEMPELERYQRQAGDTVRLVGVDAQEARELVAGFIAQVKTTFPVVIDGDGAVQRRYGVDSFPTTVVIGADGRIKLYEVGMIANADVALRGLVDRERALIARGQGISVEGYRAALAAARPPGTSATIRATRIAEAMPCPCGCADQTVAVCRCRTATGIKGRLAADSFGGRSDAEVMEALNREFCMKGM
ncbi:MAG: TlpA disulfide reductase family protein [Vicinamibacteraceae bacterium]